MMMLTYNGKCLADIDVLIEDTKTYSMPKKEWSGSNHG
jgi:hypothetical protein